LDPDYQEASSSSSRNTIIAINKHPNAIATEIIVELDVNEQLYYFLLGILYW
jgi:hypothetical protein